MEENYQNFNLSQIKLIVGLGNDGKIYQDTRHNVGFLFLDQLEKEFKKDSKLNTYIGQSILNNSKITLAKPTTMMNLSGIAVHKLLNYYKLKNEELLVAHDDLDLVLGSFKIQFGKGPKVHNGISSIDEFIGNNYWRLRIGIDNRPEDIRSKIVPSDYVLNKFGRDELKIIGDVFTKILTTINIKN